VAHVTIVGLILALVAGLVSATLFARTPHGRRTRAAKLLPTVVLLYNLRLAGWLVLEYLRTYAVSDLRGAAARPAVATFLLVIAAVAALWLRAHIHLAAGLLAGNEGDSTRPIRTRATLVADAIAGLASAALAVAWVVSVALEWGTPIYRTSGIVLVGAVPTALVTAVWLLGAARRVADPPWRRAVTQLAAAYTACLGALLLVTAASPWLVRVAPVPAHAFALCLEALYSVASVWWALRRPIEVSGAQRAEVGVVSGPFTEPAGDVETLFVRFGITKREREIVELICQGKTNQQIADALFISLTTVKDHNYAIFQKAGVRNRTALARLFLGGAPGRSAPADPR